MHKANFKLEVITPLMMSSGEITDGKKFSETSRNKQGMKTTINWQEKLKTTELRASSIKGALRWWFRAILGGDNIEQLKKSEDEIFGSTDSASKIKIKIENAKIEINQWCDKFWANYRCSDVEGKNYPINGYQYLAYTNYLKTTREEKIDIRKFITHGSTFNLIIASMDKWAFEHALISFWFALHFGAFGNRARRGFGKLQSNQVDILPKPLNDDILKYFEFCSAKDLESHKRLINQGIVGWKQYRQSKGISSIPHTKYTNMVNAKLFFIENNANFNCKETLDKTPYTTWELALNEAGKRFQYFRQEYQPDKSAVLTNNIAKLKKPVFGLPIGYRFSNRRKPTVKHKEEPNRGIGDRFASPVMISIHKIGNHYYPAFLFMALNPAQGMDITVDDENGKFKNNNTVFDEFIGQQLNGITPIEFKL